MVVSAYVGLGSNLGQRELLLASALAALNELPGTRVTACSPIEETRPLGPIPKQPRFLNAVAALQTLLPPLDLLDRLLAIEQSMGRLRKERWGPRTIDLDLLLFGHRRIDHPRLRVPHPEIAYRPFVLAGLRLLHAF